MNLGVRILITLSLLSTVCVLGAHAQGARDGAQADSPLRPVLSPCRMPERQRKTICFSKSLEMHEAIIKLYIDQHNRQHHL